MLVLFAILAVASAAFLLFRYSRWQMTDVHQPRSLADAPPPNARPLFAPTDDELRRETEENAARRIARREYRARADVRAKVDAALARWRTSSDGTSAAELLRVTAENGLESDFSRAAEEIVRIFRTTGVAGLSAPNLAELLDSHCRILPAAKRSSGDLFWLREEIASLGAKG